MGSLWTVYLFSLLISVLCLSYSEQENLYGVLNVEHSATGTQIKTAYRRMAKKWHPDKNKDPEAKDKFLLVNKAYDVLSDPKRRHRYDMTGDTEDPKPQAFHGQPEFFAFFGGGPRRRDDGISDEDFFERLLPGSHKKIYLLYFYHEFCVQCMGVDQLWRELGKELGPLEVGMATVLTSMEPKVTRYCGVGEVPAIVGVVAGRAIPYRQHIGGSRDILNFLFRIVPFNLVTQLTNDKSGQDFLEAVYVRNRPRVVLAFRLPEPPLPYLLAAFYMRHSLDFAYVSTGDREGAVASGLTLGKAKILYAKKQLLVFKEEPVPHLVEQLTSSRVDIRKLRNYVQDISLYLPRFNSPANFKSLCSVDKSRLCLTLVVETTGQYNDTITESFRRLSKTGSHPPNTQLMAVFAPAQTAFLNMFKWSARGVEKCQDGQPARKILVLERPTTKTVQYGWLDQYCGGPLPDLTFDLTQMNLVEGSLRDSIVDEEGPGFFGRLWNRIESYWYGSLRMMDTQGLYVLFSILVTGIMVCVITTAAGTQDNVDQRGRRSRSTSNSTVGSGHASAKFSKKQYDAMKLHQKGILTIIAFAEDGSDTRRAFGNAFKQHKFTKMNVKAFYMSPSNGQFLKSLLENCPDVGNEEVQLRVFGCTSGRVATAVGLIGSKRQILLFPQEWNFDTAQACNNGTINNRKDKIKNSSVSTGEVLGSALGYETDNTSEDTESGDDTDADKALDGSGGLVDQVRLNFGTWLERLADGSLRRLTVSEWPEWT